MMKRGSRTMMSSQSMELLGLCTPERQLIDFDLGTCSVVLELQLAGLIVVEKIGDDRRSIRLSAEGKTWNPRMCN